MPNRVIKDSIKRSPQIDSLTWFEEVVFFHMILTADDYGCLDGRTIVLKNDLFPAKETVTKKAIEEAVSKLVSVGLLRSYEVNGMPYLFFPTWEKHQRVRNKFRKYPEPPSAEIGRQQSGSCRTIDGQTAAECRYEVQSESESESEAGSACAREEPLPPEKMSAAAYCELCLRGMSPGNYEELRTFMADDGLPDDLVRYAVDDACKHESRTWSYVCRILNRYVTQGIKTVDQARADKMAHEAKKQSGGANEPLAPAEDWGGDL